MSRAAVVLGFPRVNVAPDLFVTAFELAERKQIGLSCRRRNIDRISLLRHLAACNDSPEPLDQELSHYPVSKLLDSILHLRYQEQVCCCWQLVSS